MPAPADAASLVVGRFATAVLAATRPDAVTGATVRLLATLGARWHVILTGHGSGHRRLSSHRCSRALFERVVGTGAKPVSLGGSGGLLTFEIHAQLPGAADDWARCAFALPLHPRWRDDDLDYCAETLRHALYRLLSLMSERRRKRLLTLVLGRQQSRVFVFNTRGVLVDCHPADASDVPEAVSRLASSPAARRSHREGQSVTIDGERMDLVQSWLEGEHGDDERLLVIELRPSHTVGAEVHRQFVQCGLTEREVQVAELIVQGRSNRAIATSLCISQDTVKTHCRHLFGKLGINRRTDFLPLLSESADDRVSGGS